MSPKMVRTIGWIGIGIIVLLNFLVLIFLAAEIYSSHQPGPLVINRMADFQAVFEAYKERADNVQKLVTALIGLSSLYALALGFTTFLSAQQYLQTLKDNTASSDAQAKNSITQIDELRTRATADIKTLNDDLRGRIASQESAFMSARENMDRLRNDADQKISAYVRSMEASTRRQLREMRLEAERNRRELQQQFPLFGSIDRMFRDLLTELEFLSHSFMVDFEEIDDGRWRDVRQKILFYERAFAGFDLIDSHVYKREIIAMFGYLSRFYRKNFQKSGQADDDLDRARFYAGIAATKSGRRYMTLNNYAAAWLEKRTAEGLNKARELARESLNKHPYQQRALYILAWISDEEGNFPEAIANLERALPIPVWEDRPDRMQAAVPYNLACVLSKLAKNRDLDREANLDKAVTHLKTALKAERQLRGQFEEDVRETGDLEFLAAARPLQIPEIRAVY